MMRAHWMRPGTGALRTAFVRAGVIALVSGLSCTENLPSGPDTFASTLSIVVPHDTIVVGDSSTAEARAVDADGHTIQSLKFNWASADPAVLGFAAAASDNADAADGRTQRFVGKRSGRSAVTLTLPDTRFVTSAATRTQTVVVAGVRILSTHDSTLTAVNDTVRAIAAGLVRANGQVVTRVSQGLRWIHLGTRTSVVGTGDTVFYISRANGADTLIATSDFCLVGAKCADTAIVRVSQQLTLTLSTRSLLSWSFADSLAPIVTLADRRGSGTPGTIIRFVPLTAADSALVKVSATIGQSIPSTGVVATPRLVTSGNGTATVQVIALAPDGVTVLGTDQVTITIRQVARRVAAEPIRAIMSPQDSIPYRAVARDAHNIPILDASISISSTGLNLHGIWAGPVARGGASSLGTITPSLSGIALPSANPLAPQFAVVVQPAEITILADQTAADTAVTAGNTSLFVSGVVIDSTGVAAAGQWVRFRVSSGVTPDSVQLDANGFFSRIWTPLNVAGPYTITAVRSAPSLASLADSAGRIVVRRSVTVVADIPSAATSTVAISATTIAPSATAVVTVNVRDRFGNFVKTATPASFTYSANNGGTFSGAACSQGVCTVTYKAPGVAGQDVISVQIGGTEIQLSPITVTIQ